MNIVLTYFFSWLVLISLSADSFAKNVNPDSLQAAYIQKFINYIDWPFSPNDKFIIAVLHNPAMTDALANAFANILVQKKQVQVLSIDKIDLKASYNILHLEKLDQSLVKETTQLKLQGLLIITQSDSGLDDHSQINFFLDDDGKLRFDINLTSANEHGLKINSRLLNLARSLK